MRIAVLALQGAFAEHRQKLAQLGVDSFEVRQLKDWDQPKDGLIIPGGESTTQAKLLNELGLMEPVKRGDCCRLACLWYLCRLDSSCQED